MPRYDFECSCGLKEERTISIIHRDDPQLCPMCQSPMKRLFPLLGDKRVQVFEAGWWENIDTNPVYVESRKHLRQLCKEKGLTSHYLENSGIPLNHK